ncbi:MAG: hypothetical protein C5B50_10245 [Verrucomicrobia bacterium]|nr:MAG: hypothetical protein C5B50_10245 [Verrucomicrobiota bacterium]
MLLRGLISRRTTVRDVLTRNIGKGAEKICGSQAVGKLWHPFGVPLIPGRLSGGRSARRGTTPGYLLPTLRVGEKTAKVSCNE